MWRFQRICCLSLIVTWILSIEAFVIARDVVVQSPDERVRLLFEVDSANGKYSVERDGKLVIEPSALAVRLAGEGDISAGAAITNMTEHTIDQWVELPWGKTRRFREHCRAATVRLESQNGMQW